MIEPIGYNVVLFAQSAHQITGGQLIGELVDRLLALLQPQLGAGQRGLGVREPVECLRPEVEDLVDHTGHYATGSPILRRHVGDGRFVKES